MSSPPASATALVTGATSGIGRALADELTGRGYRVLGTSRDPQARHPSVQAFLRLDAADPADRERFLLENHEVLLEINILVNNCGSGCFGDPSSHPGEAITGALQLLLETPMQLTKAVLPGMRSRGGGQVVFMSSLAAVFPLPYLAIYSAAKAGLSQFAAGMEMTEDADGVKFLDVQAGDFRTGFNRNMVRAGAMSAPEAAAWKRLEALLESGPPAERAARAIARAIARNRGGQLRPGGLFQTRVAPLGARLLPRSLLFRMIRRYYRLSRA
jgi:short-subunit dehydrogenase